MSSANQTRLKILIVLCVFLGCAFLFTRRDDPSQNTFHVKAEASKVQYVPVELRATFSDVEYKYHFLSEPDMNSCYNKTLFAYILSRPSSFEQRQAIRSTWAHPNKTTHVSFFFAVGQPNDVNISKELETENRIYKDLIMTDIVDAYRNLSLKVYAGLDWYNRYCSDVTYFMKIDEDVVLHVDRLVYFAKTEFQSNSNKTIFCATWTEAKVYRNKNSKLYISKELYKPEIYPTFCSGATYLISAEAANVILKKAADYPRFPIDDILYTGVLAEATNASRVDKRGIFWRKYAKMDKSACDVSGVPRLATMYEYKTPETLKKAYSMLNKIKCANEKL